MKSWLIALFCSLVISITLIILWKSKTTESSGSDYPANQTFKRPSRQTVSINPSDLFPLRNASGKVIDSSDPYSVKGVSEEDVTKRIIILGGEMDEYSLNIALSWIFTNKAIPKKILDLSFSEYQKCELITHYIDFVSSKDNYNLVIESLDFIKSDSLKISMKSKLSAAAVEKGNIDWAVSALETANHGVERNAQIRAVIDHASPADLNSVLGILRGLKDPIEIREAQLSLSKWFFPKLDKKTLSSITVDLIGEDFYPLAKRASE